MIVEDAPFVLPEKILLPHWRDERPQYRVVSWHLNEDFYPEYMLDESGKVFVKSWEALLEYVLSAQFCYSPALPWHYHCLLKILPNAIKLARAGSLTLWSPNDGPYYLTYKDSRTSAKLNVSCGSRHGCIGSIEWILPADKSKWYGSVMDMPDEMDLGRVHRLIKKVLSTLCPDLGLRSPDLSYSGALISEAMRLHAPDAFSGDNYKMQNEFNKLIASGDAETIVFGGDGVSKRAHDKVRAVGSEILKFPKRVKFIESRDIPNGAFHGKVRTHFTIAEDLPRSPNLTRLSVYARKMLFGLVGDYEKTASLDDIRVMQRHPEYGKYELLEDGIWVVPVGSGRAFEDIEDTLFDYGQDPELTRMTKELGFSSYGVLQAKLIIERRGELPTLPVRPGDVLKDPKLYQEWSKYFTRVPRYDYARAPSCDLVLATKVTSAITSEIREFALMSNANGTLWDCVKGCEGDFPGVAGNEMGQYKDEVDEGFYINDGERGPKFRDAALSQKPGDTKLTIQEDYRVLLTMVDNKRYFVKDVGRLIRGVVECSFGSPKRFDNPRDIDELLGGKRTRPPNANKDDLSKLERTRGVTLFR